MNRRVIIGHLYNAHADDVKQFPIMNTKQQLIRRGATNIFSASLLARHIFLRRSLTFCVLNAAWEPSVCVCGVWKNVFT